MTATDLHARFEGPIVMIGFGSIGKGTLPLIEKHIAFDRAKFTVIAKDDKDRHLLDERQLRFIHLALTKKNYREVLTPLLTAGPGRALIVNVSVDTSSVDLMELCKDSTPSISTPWSSLGPASTPTRSCRRQRAPTTRCASRCSNCAAAGRAASTAISCCGANPGMVSWFVKQALLDIAADTGLKVDEAANAGGMGAADAEASGSRASISPSATPSARASPKPQGVFVNTWSVEGFVAEGLQPSELGWGTHEKVMPAGGFRHDFGSDAAIYLTRPGASTRVRSWTPTAEAQLGFLITHNESISIADYFTLKQNGKTLYRPTCHYAYHPCDDAVLSLHEMAGKQWKPQKDWQILSEDNIVDGIDELGVLLYGHAKNAYWYGSQLSIEETRDLAPYQNATGLQVTSAVLAGIIWMLENPDCGIVEADEMDFRRCLEVQRPYLGPVIGKYTDWTPLDRRGELFPEDVDRDDPWQFKNVLVH